MTLGLVATLVAVVGGKPAEPQPVAPEVVQAGPLDDTIEYIECLVRLLQGLECDTHYGDEEEEEEGGTDPEQGDPVETP